MDATSMRTELVLVIQNNKFHSKFLEFVSSNFRIINGLMLTLILQNIAPIDLGATNSVLFLHFLHSHMHLTVQLYLFYI